MKKLIAVAVLMAVFGGVAWAYCHVDPVCNIRCQRECFANDRGGDCIQYCNKACEICQ